MTPEKSLKFSVAGLLLGFLIVSSGCTLLFGNQSASTNINTSSQPEEAMGDDQTEDDLMIKDDNAGEAKATKDDEMSGDDSSANNQTYFTGAVLAGSSSPLLDFNSSDYQKALASGKLIMLYFYANWCPICRAEFPKMAEAFNKLTTSQVVGFRVNFNDTETDDDEKNLARQFGVAY